MMYAQDAKLGELESPVEGKFAHGWLRAASDGVPKSFIVALKHFGR